MSTRATYLLSTADEFDRSLCYYIHHDGYPEGAANYFWNMHCCKNMRSGYAGRFFRANDNAEFTRKHSGHGDTQFRYEIDKNGTLKAIANYFNIEQWDVFYYGPWYDFVNKYLGKHLGPGDTLMLFKMSPHSNFNAVMTINEAMAYIKEKLDYVAHAKQNGWLGNARLAEEEATLIQEQLNRLT